MINNDQTLQGAISEFGNPIKVWDDGSGPLWAYQESLGIVGIIRAQTWEKAYECMLDSILEPIADDEIPEAYGLYILPDNEFAVEVKVWTIVDDVKETRTAFSNESLAKLYIQDIIKSQERDLIEGYDYQPNSTGSGIVLTDLNGSYLSPLTAEFVVKHSITLQIKND